MPFVRPSRLSIRAERDGRRRYRLPFRRTFARRRMGGHSRRQYRRHLQRLRGGKAGRDQARRLCELKSRRRILPAGFPHRARGDDAPGFALRRRQGVRRGARSALCRQTRPRGDRAPDRPVPAEADQCPDAEPVAEPRGHGATRRLLRHRPADRLRDCLRHFGEHARLVRQSRSRTHRLRAARQCRRLCRINSRGRFG